MKTALNGFFGSFNAGLQSLASRFVEGTGVGAQSHCPDLLEAVEQARREWETAKDFFEGVTDPDLVDYAIFQVQATQKRYSYLLRQAREEGLIGDSWSFS